ncbi:MAG: TonB-dependent receptor, partial [Caldilineaceae bacterium]|nr:TonB-dependent receptor [Caldilineaceae bacterium]
ERIEVIRGPGGTLWGSNAVNGVINIITRSSADTHGTQLSAGIGSDTRVLAGLRHGGELTDDVDGRFYVNHRQVDDLVLAAGGNAHDGSDLGSAGFRIDGEIEDDRRFTLQGDVYHFDATLLDLFSPSSPLPVVDMDADGWNLLGRLNGGTVDGAEWQLQAYVARADRQDHYLRQIETTVDLEFQYRTRWLSNHEIVWGFGYRHIDDEFRPSPWISMVPAKRNGDIVNAFVQDEIVLVPDTLDLVLGAKVEHHYFTETNIQPNARLIWRVVPEHVLWGSVARAVRTPSRADRSVVAVNPGPPVVTARGNPDQANEEMTAFELGYRYAPRAGLSVDLALFYNEYDDLWSTEPQLPNPLNQRFANLREGTAQGAELFVEWLPAEDLRLRFAYAYVDLDIRHTPASLLFNGSSDVVSTEGTPRNTVSVQLSYDVSDNWDWDLWGTYTDRIQVPGLIPGVMPIDSHFDLNTRIAWRAARGLELSLTALNLFDDGEVEYVGEFFTPRTEVPASIMLHLRWDMD